MGESQSHWRKLAHVCLFLLLSALMACGSNGNPVDRAQSGTFTPQPRPAGQLTTEESIALSQNFSAVLPPQVYALLGGMGRPATQPTDGARDASVWLPQVVDAGLEYTPAGQVGWVAKSDSVTTGPGGAFFAPSGSTFPDNFAFIVYRYDDLWEFDKPQTVKLEASAHSGNIGVAMYNWAAGTLGRWEPVYYGPAEPLLSLPLNANGTDFTNAEGNLAFVVFGLAPATLELTRVTVSNSATNIAPWAQLVAGSIKVGTPATLDASNSGDMDGSVVKYEFDPEGNGSWIDNGNSPLFQYSYSATGMYTAKVRVTDNEGKTGFGQLMVLAMPATYSELEGNDDLAQANTLPAIPFADYAANCGETGGNDGDTVDIYSFDAAAGEAVTFTMLTANQSCTMQVSIVDANNDTLAFASGFPTNVHYEVTGTEALPLYLRVDTFAQDSDYLLSGAHEVRYDEFESNDTVLGADGMWELDENHVLTAFDASLGSGPDYPGNDGDSEDYFRVQAGALGATLDLTMTYNAATGNLGISLLDSEGDLLANAATGSGSEHLNYTFVAGDEGPFFLHCVAASGYSDYELNATIVYDGSNYDEVEPNDDVDLAGQLPAIPFTGFRGNVGFGGSYDDDGNDYYVFDGQPGDVVNFTVTLSNPASTNVGVWIWDEGLFETIGESSQIGNVVYATATIPDNGIGPYVFVVSEYNLDQDSDYLVDAEPGT
jgi:hypothetical protein